MSRKKNGEPKRLSIKNNEERRYNYATTGTGTTNSEVI
jgi:hypothetical protein